MLPVSPTICEWIQAESIEWLGTSHPDITKSAHQCQNKGRTTKNKQTGSPKPSGEVHRNHLIPQGGSKLTCWSTMVGQNVSPNNVLSLCRQSFSGHGVRIKIRSRMRWVGDPWTSGSDMKGSEPGTSLQGRAPYQAWWVTYPPATCSPPCSLRGKARFPLSKSSEQGQTGRMKISVEFLPWSIPTLMQLQARWHTGTPTNSSLNFLLPEHPKRSVRVTKNALWNGRQSLRWDLITSVSSMKMKKLIIEFAQNAHSGDLLAESLWNSCPWKSNYKCWSLRTFALRWFQIWIRSWCTEELILFQPYVLMWLIPALTACSLHWVFQYSSVC